MNMICFDFLALKVYERAEKNLPVHGLINTIEKLISLQERLKMIPVQQ